MSNIRYATLADLPVLVSEGGKDMLTFQGLAHVYDYDKLYSALETLVKTHYVKVIETDGKVVGAFGGILAPFFWNTSKNYFQEVFWWIHSDYRNSKGLGALLLMTAEADAKEMGADLFYMSTMPTTKVSLEKHGYRNTELQFVKEL